LICSDYSVITVKYRENGTFSNPRSNDCEAIEVIDARELRIARICRDGKRRYGTTDHTDLRGYAKMAADEERFERGGVDQLRIARIGTDEKGVGFQELGA
jgi:hypothetical protein